MRSVGFAAGAVAVAFAVGAALTVSSTGGAASSGPALYTRAQAKAGAGVYATSCAQCHGAKLEGGAGPPLRGPNMVTLGTKTKLKVGDLFGYMVTNMPMNAPGSLSHDKYVELLAYILQRNGYPAGSKALTYAEAEHSKIAVTSYK